MGAKVAVGDNAHLVNRAVRHHMDRTNLTAERERVLLLQLRNGQTQTARHQALTELWESHSKLVVSVASQYRRSGLEFLDLVGAGHLGLHRAIEGFDLDRCDNRLAAYATGWIRYFIKDYVRRNTTLVRLPESNAHRQLVQMNVRLVADARNACLREGVEPTESALHDRIGQRIGMASSDVAYSLRLLHGGMLSLTASRDDGLHGRSLQDMLPDNTAVSEDDVILRMDHAKARKRIMALAEEILGDRERAIFLARCLPASGDVTSLEALSVTYGVSRERIHQLEASGRRKITTALANQGFTNPLDDSGPLRTAAQTINPGNTEPDTQRRRTAMAANRSRGPVKIAKAAG